MKFVDTLAMRAVLWAIPVLYIVPLLLTFFSPRKRDLIYFSIIGTALIRIDVFLIPSDIPIRMACSIVDGVDLDLPQACAERTHQC